MSNFKNMNEKRFVDTSVEDYVESLKKCGGVI